MITLESIKEAVAATEKEGNEGWRAMQRLDRRSVEYIRWLIEKLERQQQQVDIICDREDQEWLSKVEQVTKLESELAKEKERVKSLEKELTDFKATFLGEGIEPVKWESKL